jgi:ParB-like chromosome segregation protein Spo0J
MQGEVMPTWPADKVERWGFDRLVPYARNARTHSDAQVAQIAASIREWGWTVPVIVDEQGGLIAGHARVMAAHRLGLTEVPVVIALGWSDAKKRAYILADNKLALNAGWDPELMRLELADLRDMGQDLQVIGFAEDEITALFSAGRRGLTDPDFAPEPLPAPVTQPGEVWLLGEHRLVCGDCTEPAIAEAALAGATAQA